MRTIVIACLLSAVVGCAHHQPAPLTPAAQLDALPTPKDQMTYLLDKQQREGKFPKAEWDYLSNKQHQKTQEVVRQMCAQAGSDPSVLNMLGCPTPQQRALSNAILQQSISRGADDSYALIERQEDQAYKMRQMEDKMRQMQYDLDMARIEANDHD
jgi:hypothetical protein